MTAIHELFKKDITRRIPPVVYFHETDPEQLAAEVSEYIITGGYPKDDPRSGRVERGIHEQYVRLLRNLRDEILRGRDGGKGAELPASWISGFFGSGKSVFAKLLGCALGGKTLPDGGSLAEAWLARDDSPLAPELREAWQALIAELDPITCLFDVGAHARDGEPIHAVALRRLQTELGYSDNPNIAAEELALERDGRREEFEAKVRELHGKPWSELVGTPRQGAKFSKVMHALDPETYTKPTEWWVVHGRGSGAGLSAVDAVKTMTEMLERRAPGKHLFFIVDEVSQYIVGDNGRMLALQSFVQELGRRMRGRIWLLVTGQEKLEEQSTKELGKLKDRFPAHLRVHLDPANIREVVHRRLLAKTPEAEATLRELFAKHRQNLSLFAYGCESLTEHDFIEFYPLLPAHIELLLEMTTALRRSSRQQGDAHAIRGLLQLLGELFREQKLGDREVGALITLDRIYEIQQSSLESDAQLTLDKAMTWCAAEQDDVARRALKALALLELTQSEDNPTTAELVARCLYDRLDGASPKDEVEAALQRLKRANLVSHSEKTGYRLQSNAGADWEREREDIAVSTDAQLKVIVERMKELVASIRKPTLKGVPFEVNARFTDGRTNREELLAWKRNAAAVTLDFRFHTNQKDRRQDDWIRKSDESSFKDRILLVHGPSGEVESAARELEKSRRMVQRFQPRRSSLTTDKLRLLAEEELRVEELREELDRALRKAWRDGDAYLRGKRTELRSLPGTEFGPVIQTLASAALETLFPHFLAKAVTASEIEQLLGDSLAGLSRDLTEEGLGLVSLDAGQYVVDCRGTAPQNILRAIGRNGIAGETLFEIFQNPPYGYSSGIIQASLLALLRGKFTTVETEAGDRLTSWKDQGSRDLFTSERALRRATFTLAKDDEIGGRGRVKIASSLFRDRLGVDVAREDEAIADAVFTHFPKQKTQLRAFLDRLRLLPGAVKPAEAIARLGEALDRCTSSRRVRETVSQVFAQLDALCDGVQQLAIDRGDLTDEAIAAVTALDDLRRHQIDQLDAVDQLGPELTALEGEIAAQLAGERPWRGARELLGRAEAVRERYRAVRLDAIRRLSELVEATRRRVEDRPDFRHLGGDDQTAVRGLIEGVIGEIDPDAVTPPLADLLERLPGRVRRKEDEAHGMIDSLVADPAPEVDDEPAGDGSEAPKPGRKRKPRRVTTLPVDIEHRILSKPEDVEALLEELRTRILASLETADEVRLLVRREG